MKRLTRILAVVVAIGLTGAAASAAGSKPRSHTVYPGHTLGKIAKRYNVSIDAICNANGINRRTPIKPGQKLVIPAKDDADGSVARAHAAKKKSGGDSSSKKAKTERRSGKRTKPRVHVVHSGHTLGKIAKRYKISVDALCNANGITRSTRIKPKQRLVIPGPDDLDGSRARAARVEGILDADDSKGARKRRKGKDSWRQFKKTPWKRGYVELVSAGTGKRWKGYVIGPGEKVLPKARNEISKVLASWRTGKKVDIDRTLILRIAQVSDTFGGRPIRVVSGFREHSHSATSRHPQGRALDFSVEGIPNWAVRDYLHTIGDVGVGYYPNSTFVHLDVRGYKTRWTDHAGPGEGPRYATTADKKRATASDEQPPAD